MLMVNMSNALITLRTNPMPMTLQEALKELPSFINKVSLSSRRVISGQTLYTLETEDDDVSFYDDEILPEGFTQDWFDRRFAELGRECETMKADDGWITDSFLKNPSDVELFGATENALTTTFSDTIQGNVCPAKLPAVESCFIAVVEAEKENRNAKTNSV